LKSELIYNSKFNTQHYYYICAMRIIIINGPNLNLLGRRKPSVYGNLDFEEYLEKLRTDFPDIKIEYYQSNVEGEIIDKLHETGFSYDGIILNAGGYTHTSVAIGDAVEAIESPVIEAHISNIFAREEFRHISYISPHARGIISGLGIDVYRLALLSLKNKEQ
jgi:3-dehydroquinate dehydratase-2